MDWQITRDLGTCDETGKRLIRTLHFVGGRFSHATFWGSSKPTF